MKKIYISFLTLAGIMTLGTSCSDFLEEENKVGQTADLTYATKSGIDGLMEACYAYGRGWWGKEGGLGLSEGGTDLFYYGMGNTQKSLVSYNFTSASLDNGNTSDNACLDLYWELFYTAINSCNTVLEYAPKCTAISTDLSNQYQGEALFLRALYNLHLVMIYGPIPYNTEPISTSNTTPTRLPEATVFGNILDDIDKSMSLLQQAGAMTKANASAKGHVTYYGAEALKARTLLYAASWLGSVNGTYAGKNLYQLAQDAAQDVIDHSGAKFYDDTFQTWTLANEDVATNQEALWGIYYDEDLQTAVNCMPNRLKLDDSGTALKWVNIMYRQTGKGGNTFNALFCPVWNNGCSDLGGNGKQVFIRVTKEAETTMTNTKTGAVVQVGPYYSPYGRGYTRYLPTAYLWQSLEKLRATDQRVESTLLTHYNMAYGLEGSAKNYPLMGEYSVNPDVAYARDGHYFNHGDTAIYFSPLDGDSEAGKKLQEHAKNRYRLQFMAGGDIPVLTSMDPATAVPTSGGRAISLVYGDNRYADSKIEGYRNYPCIRKFLEDVYSTTYYCIDTSKRDAVVFRLSEMYLIKAECQLALNNADGAKSTLNEIRKVRAIKGQESNNLITGTVDINTILDERAIELCAEQQRWFDLKRTHTLLDRVAKYNAQSSPNIELRHYYRPIPQAQLDGCTNYAAETVQQASNGVLNYTEESQNFWQNPGW